ncbi:hypothetical protein PHJA_001881000 [Phtheirospermum japonicum]|uniref:Protein-S-isoprenylcysteine O-methyltransferase n=1 Tax=Phtheirospermum japonicum TaxID=374723 RepID=A0A830CEC7_9LAMI|nr:hypothetical protein PHJA_001881000 [Phtheirospermum japonicum]
MEAATASFVCSKVTPFSSTLSQSSHLLSLRPFNKHLQRKVLSLKNSLAQSNSRLVPTSPNNPFRIDSAISSLSPSNSRIIRRPIKCSISSSAAPTDSDAPKPLLNSLKSTLSQLTPVDICKCGLAFSVAVAASKWTVNLLLNPFFWTYFSWTWLFWPWMVAIALAIHGVYCFTKYYLNGEASVFEQLSIVTSAFTWLTLVPPAHFNGFLEGWPFVFFFAYHYFFFLNVSVRKRLYGDYYTREHDAKWDISLPSWQKFLFCIGVVVAHWLAAFEGTELHLVPGGWTNNLGIWGLIVLAVFMQYHSTLYLAKYSEKVVVPTAVVQFGPYRFLRHPIYASTMLLFVSYFAALRAPMSALFIVGVCLVYYGEKAKMEEGLMLETFGERYSEYMSKVRYKLIPFVY